MFLLFCTKKPIFNESALNEDYLELVKKGLVYVIGRHKKQILSLARVAIIPLPNGNVLSLLSAETEVDDTTSLFIDEALTTGSFTVNVNEASEFQSKINTILDSALLLKTFDEAPKIDVGIPKDILENIYYTQLLLAIFNTADFHSKSLNLTNVLMK